MGRPDPHLRIRYTPNELAAVIRNRVRLLELGPRWSQSATTSLIRDTKALDHLGNESGPNVE